MIIELGASAPDFLLEAHDGRAVRLADLKGKRNVVLAFFPLAWTPV
jgi:peroxiredoxin